jgi:hypothetical protein
MTRKSRRLSYLRLAKLSVLGFLTASIAATKLWAGTASQADEEPSGSWSDSTHGPEIAGGFTGDAFADSAELYDPASQKFLRTGSMSVPRIGQTATLLKDGRVLIAGDFTGQGVTASAELYDPKTGRFEKTGSMLLKREDAAATLLPDGRVLITGGDTGSTVIGQAELYDPKSGTFRVAGHMHTPRFSHTATPCSQMARCC